MRPSCSVRPVSEHSPGDIDVDIADNLRGIRRDVSTLPPYQNEPLSNRKIHVDVSADERVFHRATVPVPWQSSHTTVSLCW